MAGDLFSQVIDGGGTSCWCRCCVTKPEAHLTASDTVTSICNFGEDVLSDAVDVVYLRRRLLLDR